MTNQQDNIAALLQDMKSSVSEFEQTEDMGILQRIDADFQRFAQLVTLFLIAERDTYYGYFLMSMAFRTNYAVSTIAGIRLGEYPPVFETNPLILLKYSLKEILYIFCHEIDHVVFNHPAEMMKSNPEGNPELFELFNYAADASVNDMLNAEIKHGKKFMQAPKGVVTSKVIRNKFRLSHVQPLESYQYYFDLIKHHANMLGEPQQNGIAPIPSGSAENNASPNNNAIPGGVATSNAITAAGAAGNINDHAWTFATEHDEPASESAEAMAEAVKELLNEVDSMMERRSTQPYARPVFHRRSARKQAVRAQLESHPEEIRGHYSCRQSENAHAPQPQAAATFRPVGYARKQNAEDRGGHRHIRLSKRQRNRADIQ